MTCSFRVARYLCAALAVILALAAAGCGDGRKRCYPVRGEIYIDGKPALDALITLFPVDEADPNPVRPVGRAEESGAYVLSSYVSGDGAPAGEYIVIFEWRERSGLLKNNFDGRDRLGGKYANPKTSQYRVTIEKRPNDLPRYELKSK
jgi:hypothetical protein